MAKHYQVEKVINDKKYIAQFAGLSVAQDAADNCRNGDTPHISTAKLTQYLFDHVIVEPKNLTADDFDCIEELNAVTEFAREVMQGYFRDKANEGAANKKG